MFKPFGYEPILTKDMLQRQKKKRDKATNMGATLKRIWQYVDEQRFLLLVVLAMVVLSSILQLLGPYLIGRLIDDYIVPKELKGILTILVVLAISYILLSGALFLQNYWMIDIAQQTVYRMRTDLFEQFQKLPISFFDRKQHGELMSRMTNDMDNVSATLNTTFIQVFSSILVITGTVIVMLTLSPLLTVITMLIIPVMFFATRWITRRTGPLFKLQQQRLGKLNGMVEEAISGQLTVKAYSQEQRLIDDFTRQSDELKKAGYWANIYSGGIPKVMNFLNNASFAVVALVGGILAVNGHLSVGTIVIFTEYARQFTRPLNDLANQFNNVLSAIAGAERVFEIIDEPIEKEGHTLPVTRRLDGHIEFDHVTFRYDKTTAEPTLSQLSFSIPAGKTAALIGATGAGKTTIMQLIARFYDVQEGEVRIDERPIQQITRSDLRKQMAFVLQEPFLFEGSVRENIRYGRLDATDEEIERAAKQANAHTFIETLAGGYDHLLTEDGGDISQGQKQLLSIARALVADPAILLLDEATSSIDTVTEMAIQEALDRLMVDRTSIVIAHRLNTVKNADYIFVMEKGRLIEGGERQQLLEAKGRYYDMVTQGAALD
ncbi:ABC transporter ATP-binding protein [Kurthia senegalensis]|uniref:ABC transporter ATP-binding protein n=1 Tax=Kurthia senegalensis TaxID=1033740 RepID=UPI0002899504|nr:ABC transporter ATP-binding protein [Kurthia senegalensis]